MISTFIVSTFYLQDVKRVLFTRCYIIEAFLLSEFLSKPRYLMKALKMNGETDAGPLKQIHNGNLMACVIISACFVCAMHAAWCLSPCGSLAASLSLDIIHRVSLTPT